MKPATQQFLAKAQRAIAAAQRELTGGDTETAIGRAYYAMFYVAEALLNEQGLRFKKHGGVHGAFGEHFAKPGVLDPKYHQWLLAAFEKRITADYGIEDAMDSGDAEVLIAHAREFLAAAHTHLARS